VHIVLRIASGVLIAYVAYCGFLFLLQRHILFPRYQIQTPSGVAGNIPGLETIWLSTDYGKAEAWFLPPAAGQARGPAPAVIFAHGNAELIDFWPQELGKFTSLGIGLLLVEYPGYGRSEGRPSQESVTATFVEAYDSLVRRKDVDPSRIVLLGRSLGGAAVCALATRRPCAAIILMSSFTSVRSFALRFFAPGFLIRDRFDNLAAVRSYAGPVLIMHGKHDTLIPYKHGVALYRATRRGEMITYDCSHNDCPPSWKAFWQDVESFFHKVGILEKQRRERGSEKQMRPMNMEE
jgi:pimeloyl-ACP methyl ester carboxylesterase